MIIYQALYCCSTEESSFATISIHRTKKGAEKAVQLHKDEVKKQYNENNKFYLEQGLEAIRFGWDAHKDWDISGTELLD